MLSRDDAAIPLTPKALTLLMTLVENRGRVMQKDELMRLVWPDTIVEEANLSQTIFVLRKVLGDGVDGMQYIATAPRLGYRFVAPVVEWNGSPPEGGQTPQEKIATRGSSVRWFLLLAAAMLVLLASVTWMRVWQAYSARPKTVAATTDAPVFEPLTFARGDIFSARFTPDGRTVVYAAAWNGGDEQLFTLRLGGLASVALPVKVDYLIGGVTSSGDVFVRLPDKTLVRSSLSGDAPTVVAQGVGLGADSDREGQRVAIVHRIAGGERIEFPLGVSLAETAGAFSEIRVSPLGDAVACVEHFVYGAGAGRIAVVDLSGRKKVLSDGWFHAEGLAWSPSGQEIWFTAGKEGFADSIYAVTLDGRLRVLARMPPQVMLHDVADDGRALITRITRRVAILAHLSGETGSRDISFLDMSYVADLSVDGRTLLFWDWAKSSPIAYIQKLDGSHAVRLGDGRAMALSPDGLWALTVRGQSAGQLLALPTGGGQPRLFEPGPVVAYESASWMPDGQAVVFVGWEPGHKSRMYVQPFDGGPPRPVTGEGVRASIYFGHPVSPDGRSVIAPMGSDGRLWLYSLAGGQQRPVAGTMAFDRLLRWSDDGRSVFVTQAPEKPARIYRLDLTTGQRSVWRELALPDRGAFSRIVITPDGQTYAGSYTRRLGQLFQVRGLH